MVRRLIGVPVRVAVVSLVLLVAVSPLGGRRGAQAGNGPAPVPHVPQSAAVSFLARYASGDHAGPVGTLAAVRQIDVYLRMLRQDGPVWIAAAPDTGESARRRFVVAAFVLEVTEARLQEDWADLRDLVEWACVLLRADPPGPRELAWQRAALAVIEGAYDARFLMTPPPRREGEPPPVPLMFDHAAHVRARFPEESRFALADAFVAETRAPREAPYVPAPGTAMTRLSRLAATRSAQRLADAVSALAPWLDDPAIGLEARLRTGYLQFRAGDADGALAEFGRAVQAEDTFVRYLAHFFSGRAHDRQGARAEAESAYRRALDALPGAQSAAVALSTALFLADQPDEAYAVMDAAGRVSPPPPDPWRLYGYGDYRRWPELRRALRAELRTQSSTASAAREGAR